MGDYRDVTMKVHLPFGERYQVRTIASNVEHLGNRVAEGDLHPSLFWPMLARLERAAAQRARRQYLDQRNVIERAAYAAGWCDRWLDYWEGCE